MPKNQSSGNNYANEQFCPNCGAPVSPGANFCPGCGGTMGKQLQRRTDMPPATSYRPNLARFHKAEKFIRNRDSTTSWFSRGFGGGCGWTIGVMFGNCLAAVVILLLVVGAIAIFLSKSVEREKEAEYSKYPKPAIPQHPQQTKIAQQAQTRPVPTPPDIAPPVVKPSVSPRPEPLPAPKPPDWNARRAELEPKYRAEFVAPKLEESIPLQLENGYKIRGIIKSLTEDKIMLKSEDAIIGFTKDRLSQESRMLCFASDYATIKADAQIKQEREVFEAKQQAEAEKILAEQKRREDENRQREEKEKQRAEVQRAKENVAAAQLVAYDSHWSVEYGFVTVEGQVGNISGQKIENVQALASFYTADKTFITSESALIEYNPLMPGQVSPFKVIVSHNPLMKSVSVSFKTLFGPSLKSVTKEEYNKSKQ